ncbi:hypothetical protein [Alkaliphilus sp. B6464]|uniref:hypothetical protein n=1 Tax=Alkaliphilus sp. B6464 TaxID=2731219 RepID=UPI001BA9537A|nr:hypothetical protein [Alkaliphilus sp. B6464]QUH20350.1 hypothetical protein HYG84_10860 [Alkaliphilus sp. B6464]
MDIIKVMKGMACGVIYVSSFFWTMVLTFIYIDNSFGIILLSAILTNIIVGLLIASKSHLYAFYKWLISLPVGIITFLVYRETDFVYYWLNKIMRGYGNLSAGGSFALLFYMIFYLLSFLIAIITSVYFTNQRIKKTYSNEL